MNQTTLIVTAEDLTGLTNADLVALGVAIASIASDHTLDHAEGQLRAAFSTIEGWYVYHSGSRVSLYKALKQERVLVITARRAGLQEAIGRLKARISTDDARVPIADVLSPSPAETRVPVVAQTDSGIHGFYERIQGRYERVVEPERARIEEQVATINTLGVESLDTLRAILKQLFPRFTIEREPGVLLLARSKHHAASLVATQALTCAEAKVAPGDDIDIFVNQGTRPGVVLATTSHQYLVEYTMPKGSTALQVFTVGVRGGKTVSYRTLPKHWLQAIVDGGQDWIANPQGRTCDAVPSAAFLLAQKK